MQIGGDWSVHSNEFRLDREVGVESAGPDSGLQRAEMDIEIIGQLVERQ